MKILVVGGTGLIGRHAALELEARGHEVSVLARRPPEPAALPPGVGFVRGDLDAAADVVAQTLRGFDGLVHAAGTDYRITPRGSAWEFFARANVEASVRLFEAAVGAGIRRAAFVTSFYHAVQPALAEEHPYVGSRAESEVEALRVCAGKLDLAIVQPPNILGRSNGRWSLGLAIARYVRRPGPLLAPPGGTNFLSARSLAQAIAAALERGRSGARYLVGDENLLWSGLLERFAAASGRSRKARIVPRGLLRLAAAGFAAWATLARREPGVRPGSWSRVIASDFFYDSTAAQRELGYTVGNLDDEIRELVRAAA